MDLEHAALLVEQRIVPLRMIRIKNTQQQVAVHLRRMGDAEDCPLTVVERLVLLTRIEVFERMNNGVPAITPQALLLSRERLIQRLHRNSILRFCPWRGIA